MSNSPSPVVCVVGATGLVGGVLLRLMEERNFPVGELRPLSSKRSAGTTISFKGHQVAVQELTADAFDGADLVFFAATSALSREFAPEAVKRGAVVLDKSGSWRMEPNVPLVVPEINADELNNHQGIIAIPNCSVTGFAMVLQALAQVSPPTDVVVTTFQSASGAGAAGTEQLREGGEGRAFPRPLLGDVLPQCETFLENGYTTEEEKMLHETRKILDLPDLQVTMTCTRVPVEVGHASAMLVTTKEPVSVEAARQAVSDFPGLELVDDPAAALYPTPKDTAGHDAVRVGRIRLEQGGNRLWFWQVTDNLRKGAALNSIQVAEELLSRGLACKAKTN
jgi:aspartate-semialdehyde dehydrogenase